MDKGQSSLCLTNIITSENQAAGVSRASKGPAASFWQSWAPTALQGPAGGGRDMGMGKETRSFSKAPTAKSEEGRVYKSRRERKQRNAHRQAISGGRTSTGGQWLLPRRSCLKGHHGWRSSAATVHAGCRVDATTGHKKQRTVVYLSGISDSSRQSSLCRSGAVLTKPNGRPRVKPVQSHCSSNTRSHGLLQRRQFI